MKKDLIEDGSFILLFLIQGVDLVCISDNYWLGKSRPCLTYGLRGLAYFGIEVECGSKDLHSGVFGGSV
jgi:nonspecific dipeptidase